MKAYSVALVASVVVLCTGCARAPCPWEIAPAKAAFTALPIRKPALALVAPGQSTAVPPASAATFIPRETPGQTPDAAAVTAPTKAPPGETVPTPASSGGGMPAASLSAKGSIAAQGLTAKPKEAEASPQ